MLFWRIFLTFIGMAYGAILGLFIVGLAQWLGGLLIAPLGGAILGAGCGWTIAPILTRTVEKLKERFPPDDPPIPPPPEVLRLGYSLGIAEGIVVSAIYGGIMAAVLGGFYGMNLGAMTATLSWRVRRDISLVVLALLLGFLIEVAGCLLIVYFVKLLVKYPPLMCVLCVELAFLALFRVLRKHRASRGQQEERLDPPF